MKARQTIQLNMISAVTLCIASWGAQAEPGTLADTPLFLSSNVPANIFFLVDDSGSMDWEVLKSNSGQALYPGAPYWGNLDFTPNNTDEIRELCPGYNVLAYDPGKTYTPWLGVDTNNVPYQDMTALNAARWDPYNTWLVDLSNHFYIEWVDDGDGVLQAGECPIPTNYGTTLSRTECAAASNCIPVSGLSADEQKNYANWYSYYRKREFVAKRALSEIITNSTARMGLSTLWNNNNVRTLVTDVDDITTPIDATAAANKLNLLDNLFNVNSSGGTPLRRELENVGEYYEDASGWGPSPILPASSGGECQQNFAIVMTDGLWNGGDPAIQEADSDGNTAWDGGLYADNDTNASSTLADVAMHYYERDLDTTLANNVRTITGVDNNDTQHMVTYSVAFGVTGNLDPDINPGDAGWTGWPTPVSNTTSTIDDLRHAAYNGRGDFLSAADPQELITSLGNSIADIQSRTGTAAAVSFNSTSLQTTTKLLKASFNSDRWSGDLIAYNIDINNNTLGSIAWRASTDLNSRGPGSRKIITSNGTNGIIFDWSTLTAAQKNDLRTNSSGGLDNEATGMARLDYIRGERGCESNNTSGTCSYTDSGGGTFTSKTFRPRNSVLGDIIHSSPFYVGPPNTRYPDNIETSPYSSFAQAKAGRPGVSYVGANDGMLHAFDEGGDELFAFIPNLLYSTASGAGLHDLSDPGYLHDYYVDLSVSVADAYVNLGGGASWKSILVGGLRGGGKGLFAIDVTDPSSLSTSSGAAGKVLWEFTHNDLGYTYSDIRIGRLNNGKWAAIFGNGYNSDPSGDGTSKVFIVYLDGSNLGSPILLETGQGNISNNSCNDPGSDCNGMSTPAIADLNGDGSIDRIYAGDLHGKLWAFDLSSSNSANWKSAYGTSPNFTPMFNACDGGSCTTSNRRPITEKPAVARHPTRRDLITEPNLMVIFGTGQYLTVNDSNTTDTQAFYGVWDNGSGNASPSSLQSQTITNGVTSGGVAVRTVSDNDVTYDTQRGWKFNLPDTGERSVTNPLAFGSLVFFNTVTPSSSTCAAGGSGWLMAVDIFNGGEPDFQPIDVNGDGVFDMADKVGSSNTVGTQTTGIPTESRFISDRRVTATSDGSVLFERIRPTSPKAPERMSWTHVER